jgi:hypothetical protein
MIDVRVVQKSSIVAYEGEPSLQALITLHFSRNFTKFRVEPIHFHASPVRIHAGQTSDTIRSTVLSSVNPQRVCESGRRCAGVDA